MVLIFFVHNGYGSDEVRLPCWFAISLFFVMSGFFMEMYHPRDDRRPMKQTYKRLLLPALLRLYAVHWLALAIYLVFAIWHRGWGLVNLSLAANVALVQAYVPDVKFYFGYNGVSWFLSAFVLCYLLFPLLQKYFGLKAKILLVSITALIYLVVSPLTDGWGRIYMYVCPLLRLSDFVLGMILFHVYNKVKDSPFWRSANVNLIEITEVAVVVLLLVLGICVWWINIYACVIIWWPVATAIVLTTKCFSGREGVVGRFLSLRPVNFLGRISLELFLLCGPVSIVVAYLVIPVVNKIGGGFMDDYLLNIRVLSWFYLPFAIAFSWFIRKYFTIPLTKHFRNLFRS
ncbi:MAG: acyltransferase family protein [Muribaculaceae bacterium]|nr:acyltransferase family protein [Muribaculaceae bacterium]